MQEQSACEMLDTLIQAAAATRKCHTNCLWDASHSPTVWPNQRSTKTYKKHTPPSEHAAATAPELPQRKCKGAKPSRRLMLERSINSCAKLWNEYVPMRPPFADAEYFHGVSRCSEPVSEPPDCFCLNPTSGTTENPVKTIYEFPRSRPAPVLHDPNCTMSIKNFNQAFDIHQMFWSKDLVRGRYWWACLCCTLALTLPFCTWAPSQNHPKPTEENPGGDVSFYNFGWCLNLHCTGLAWETAQGLAVRNWW